MTLPQMMPLLGAQPSSEYEPPRLSERLEELQQERDQLVAVIDILTGVSASLHFEEILQTIARKLGEMYGLDRCSIYLAAAEAKEVRLMATYEDPHLRNLIVDLDRYPELKRAFESGQTVFITDAAEDPMFAAVRDRLTARNVGSIIVAPIRWQRVTIGAIFLRTERAGSRFTDRDVRFCQVIAGLTANALRNAHRFESLRRARAGSPEGRERGMTLSRGERERVAFVAFLRRLLAAYGAGRDQRVAEALLPEATTEEIDRLAVMAVRMLGGERVRS